MFTWFNGQAVLAGCWARLDKFLANPQWTSHFDSYEISHLPRQAALIKQNTIKRP